MTRRHFIAGLALLIGSASVGTAATRRKPTTHKVIMEGMVFRPASLTVAPGDSVVWVNDDIVEHTATASDDSWDSKMIGPAQSWRRTFKRTGEFPYVCKYHPTMKGVLRISSK